MWFSLAIALLWGDLSSLVLAGIVPNVGLHHAMDAAPLLAPEMPLVSRSLLSNASPSDIDAARKVVKDAIAEMTIRNHARLANPARNRYIKPSTKVRERAETADVDSPPPLLNITQEIAMAAALIAEADVAKAFNDTSTRSQKRAGTFWMQDLDRRGAVPWGQDIGYKVNYYLFTVSIVFEGIVNDLLSKIQVFRIVTDFGADPTGQRVSCQFATESRWDTKYRLGPSGLYCCHCECHEIRQSMWQRVQRLNNQERNCILPTRAIPGFEFHRRHIWHPSHRRCQRPTRHHCCAKLCWTWCSLN
jgi:hypothetical protein